MRSKGWRSGESTRLPAMWLRLKSWRRRHMWVEFVVGSLLCFERFFSGYSAFPLSSKTNISKFQLDQESGDEVPLCGYATFKSLHILFKYNVYTCCSKGLVHTLLLLFRPSYKAVCTSYERCLL